MKPLADADSRRGLGNGPLQFRCGAGIGREKVGERLEEDAVQRLAKRLDGGRISFIDRLTARGHIERGHGRPQRQRVPLGDEGCEPRQQSRASRGRFGSCSHAAMLTQSSYFLRQKTTPPSS